MDGVYRIMIRNHSQANALSLTLGTRSSDSRPELVVGHFSRADFGRLDVNTPITTIRSRLSVNFLTFRGQTITGGGELHVATRFFFARSSYKNSYFSRINVTVSKLFDVESRLYDNFFDFYYSPYDVPHLYCDRCYILNEIGSTFQSVDLQLFVIGNEVSSESDGFRRGLVNYGLVVLELVSSTIMAWDVRNYGEFVVVTKTYYKSKSFDYRGSFVNYNTTRIYLSSVVFGETSTVLSARGSVWKAYGYPMRRKGAPSFPEGEQVSGQWRRFIDDVYQNVATFNDSTVVWNAKFPIRIDVRYVLSSSTFSFYRFEAYGYVNFHLNNSVEFADGLYMDRHGRLSLIQRTSIDLRPVAALGNLVTGQAFVRDGWNLTIWNATFYRRSTIDDNAIVTATKGRESTLDFYDELVVNERAVLSVVDATTNCHSDVMQAGAIIQIGNGRMNVDGRFTFEAGEFVAANGTIRLRGGFDIVGNSDKVFTNVRIRIDAPKDGIPSTLQTGFSSSSFTLESDGLIFGRESVTVDVCETCQFHVLDPVRWLPDPSLGVVTTFINSGSLVRRGRPGTAVIYGHYVGNEENIHTTAKSLVLFRSLPEGKTATWTNPEGGSWNDSSNWNPRRVPLSTDVVRIALRGIYRITIPDGLVVKVTVLYAESADVELVVESSAQLIVSEFDARLANLTVKGFLQSTWFRWSGRQLDGDGASATSRSRLVVTTSFLIIRGNHRYKRIQHLVVENRGNLTNGAFFDKLVCVHCTIYNYGVYSVKGVQHLNPFNAPPIDGFRSGLINYGFVNIEVFGPLGWSWDVRNYGNFSVFARKRRCSSDFIISSIVLSNYQQISFYGIGVIVHGSTRFLKGNGSIDFFGSPYRFRGNREFDFEGNSTAWDFSWRCDLKILTDSADEVFHFNRIVFRGRWDILIDAPHSGNPNPNRFFIHSLLEMHRSSTLRLTFHYVYRPTINWHFIISPKARVNLGHLRIGRAWSVSVGAGASFDVQGELTIQRHSLLSLPSGPNSVFGDVFTLQRNGNFSLSDRLVTMNSGWTLDGHVSLTNSTTVVKGKLIWKDGLVKGHQSSTVRLLSGCEIAGNLTKTLDGIAVEISADRQSVRHGIIAEYFQSNEWKRLDMNEAKPLYHLHFPGTESVGPYTKTLPPEFDLPSMKGEMIRFEPSFDSEPEMSKPVWPLDWTQLAQGLSPTEATEPFVRSYAARFSAYLQIDGSGFYTFFFSMGRGLKIRLSLDGTFYYKSNISLSFLDEVKTSAIHIKAGLRLMRVDYISQDNEFRKTRFSYLSVKYAGPDVPKQLIPSAKLYAVRYNEENGVYEGSASSMKFLGDDRVCKSLLSVDELTADYFASVSRCRVSGTGQLLTQNFVNITVGVSGILDVASNINWPKPPAGARLRLTVNGMVVKTAGDGTTELNTVYNVNFTSGCVKSFSGQLDLGHFV